MCVVALYVGLSPRKALTLRASDEAYRLPRRPRSHCGAMATVSAVVLTRNEERHLPGCLESLAWANEIIVFDAFSTDATVAIARRFTDHVYQHPFRNCPCQRNAALEKVQGDWAFFLDADERVPLELASEVRQLLREPEAVGYWVPRQNIILGRWVRHAGWWPDYQLRLFRRGRGRFDEGQEVHEVLLLDGPAAHVRHAIVHYNYQTVGQLLSRQWRYAALE